MHRLAVALLHPSNSHRVSVPAVFNLVEGNDVEEMERKIEAYRVSNAESIIRTEARKVEELRQRAAAAAAAAASVAAAAAAPPEADAAAPAADRAGVSGTAAAFHDGQDAEPHQGMEYTAAIPTGAAAM
jgi:CDK-activating kinase assembly factor MAT1